MLDAHRGLTTQSRRHAFIATLLGIPNFVIAVNKMDLVGYDQEVFNRIRAEFEPFLERIGTKNYYFLPLSALKGDNVVDRSSHMPWFDGPCLLEYLETVEPADRMTAGAFPHGRAASGSAGSDFPRVRGADRFGNRPARR